MNRTDNAFGVVTNTPTVASEFDLVFWETKDVSGEWHETFPNAIPMICSFADTSLANSHPDWIQREKNGELATRNNKFFNYEWLCPSRIDTRDLAVNWIRKALSSSTRSHLRLDNVCFAREGYCSCETCNKNASSLGVSLLEYREKVITEFMMTCRELIEDELYLTVYPDPYPGHLLERFGVRVERLKQLVDVFVVPIFDTAYGTTYWLETIAKGFQDLFAGHPWYIELYGDGIEPTRLLKATQVANAYADGVLIAYAADVDLVKSIERKLTKP